jgi:hypothetical protein
MAAAAGGRPGNFVAFLSTSSTNAIDRLAGSRGWVRTDGVPALDTIDSAITNAQMFQPIDRDEHGVRVAYGSGAAIWTGSGTDGKYLTTISCQDWTNGTSGFDGALGDFAAAGGFLPGAGFGPSCDQRTSLLCFEIGHDVEVVAPTTPITGRIAFVSTPVAVSSVASFDQQCTIDASNAGLPGTYLAAVATTTSTIASRFTLDARPIQRVDGALVATTAAGLLGTTDPLTFINLTAAGGYVAEDMWTGAADPTSVGTAAASCNSWTVSTSAVDGRTGRTSATLATLWGGTFVITYPMWICSELFPVLCLQE